MAQRWRIHAHDADQIAHLERSAGVSPVIARLLICRGIVDPSAAKKFLDAKLSDLRNPDELPGVPAAVDRIYAAIQDGRRITIYGDYDADGMTGTAILVRCLRLLGANVGYFVPNRLDDGYGLNDRALRTLAERGTNLVVTVDCGIASVDRAETARQLQLELIVTDHHEFADRLPHAAAIVHPRLPGHSYPFSGLCGAGVAFKLAWALCQRASDAQKVSPRMREFLLSAMGLAAIGTVADIVPLIDENRVLVRHGLASLASRPLPGLQQLLRITKLDQKPALESEDIAFMLAPRLNAAGRLGQAQLGVELLTTDDTSRAESLAEYIHELNNNRDHLDRSVYLQASKQLKEQFDEENDTAFVLAGRGWHAGVIGIVAGRLAEKYHRPTVLIALDELGDKPGMGSARSACGLNLHAAFTSCRENLVSYGGHAAAAGLRVHEADIDRFRAEFCEYAANEIAHDDLVAELLVDVEAPLSQLTLAAVQQIEQMSPFGFGNSRPVLCASGVELSGPPRRMGGGDRHLSLKLRHYGVALRAVAFGRGDWADEISGVQGPLDIAFRPVINQYRGRRSVELHLLDWRAARMPAAQL